MRNSGPRSPDSTRAGRYVSQPGNYRAFIPAPLPPRPAIKSSQALQRLLSQADRALGRLDGVILTLPSADLFVYMYVRKEAVLSSQIEGTQSSLQDVLAAEAKILAPNRPRDVGEVVNYVAAMNYGLERLAKLPVSVRLLREIHKILLHRARGAHLTPGELRRSQNWIGPAGCTLKEAALVPPPPDEIGKLMGDLEQFLHAEDTMPLLMKVGLAHAQFETIHPFLDGNGRLGRLLIIFLLCEQGALQKPVLYLSHYFKAHRQRYYEELQAVRDKGTWEKWLSFFLRGVAEVSVQATETARRILVLREEHRRLITNKLGRVAGNGYRVLESLYERPIVSVKDIRELIGTTYPAANEMVSRLVDCGLLREITGRARNRKFMYDKYVELFLDNHP